MERSRREARLPQTGGPVGFDCDAGVNLLLRLWMEDARGSPPDSAARGLWAGHTRGCTVCARCFRDLGVLAGYGATDQPVPIRAATQVRSADACLTMLNALRPWAGARIVGQDGKTFEPAISGHMCWCFGCRQLFELFGGDIGLSFGDAT